MSSLYQALEWLIVHLVDLFYRSDVRGYMAPYASIFVFLITTLPMINIIREEMRNIEYKKDGWEPATLWTPGAKKPTNILVMDLTRDRQRRRYNNFPK